MPETRMFVDDKFAVADLVLTSAVANSGTFTVGYPTGFTQGDFLGGLAGTAHYMLVNDNDRWTAAASQMSLSFGASDITVTNSTGGTLALGSRVRVYVELVDGNNVEILSFPVNLASVTGAVDVVTNWRPGIDGIIEGFDFIVGTPVTTAARAASFNLEIGTTNVTGGVIALTSANSTPLGAVISGSAITANNRLTRSSQLSIEAASVTAFAEGSGVFQVRVRRTTNLP